MTTPQWRKSSYSGDSSNCVETAVDRNTILVRDSKTTTQADLAFSCTVWEDFLSHVREAA
ncbi:DUF397 domain-containing protein [Streptomyces sp. NPDC023723]|uniref:DUF397 domain-containing protein n=1 Tax=Streptomyces sp. NPDC023723 TaxID=3154323 RepID=UPI00340EBE19